MNFQRSEHILPKNVHSSEQILAKSVQSCEQIMVEKRIIGKNSTKPMQRILSLG